MGLATDIKIEKGIPLPKQNGRAVRYPFDGMEINDSFYVPGIKSSADIRGSIGYAMAKRGWKFACRKDGDGVRVWRTA